MSKPSSSAGIKATSSAGNGKAKAVKFIPSTSEMLRANAARRRHGKGKERAILNDLQDLIKGSNTLPGAVQVERFAETRAMEILAFKNAMKIASSQSNSRAFQSLPRHLRRRAASHNPRRVPKRLRNRAAAEIDPADPTVRIHRKKAKLRARGNLRGESRTEQLLWRQRHKKWLSTHVWHAKRFHMANLWGYRLPLSPTLKSFRSSFRAARRKAILHDASYFGTIELEGERSDLLAALGKVTAGPAFAGDKYESGARVAHTNVFHPASFPQGLIGPVDILWQPRLLDDSTTRRLWIRVHPSIFDDTIKAVRQAVSVPPAAIGVAGPSTPSSHVHVRDLRDDLETFEIMGSLAGQAISRVLRLCPLESAQKRKALEQLLLADPAECPKDAVFGFRAYDPRLSFPPTRLSDEVRPEGPLLTAVDTPVNSEMAFSPLWESSSRTAPRFKKADLDKRRQSLSLPGTRLRAESKDDRVPVMLVKRTVQSATPGQESAAFHGYTLVFPRGWAMAMLPSFSYCNVRIGGIAQRRVQYREAGAPSFPEHFGSVCEAGAASQLEQAKEEERRWLRKPPGKRPEYSTLGTEWPFRPDWSAILSTATEEEHQANGLAPMRPWLFNSAFGQTILERLCTATDPCAYLIAAVNAFRKRRGLSELSRDSATEIYASSVLHVNLDVVGRGSPSDMAMLYPLDAEERAAWCDAYQHDVETNGHAAMLRLGEQPPASPVIGFVQTGNISLTRGKGHALATLPLAEYVRLARTTSETTTATSNSDSVLIKFRNRDGLVHRLASVSLVE